MVDFMTFLPYLIVMAGVTYLVRMLPLVLVRKKIENKFVRSFLYYIPYAVFGVMTIPAVFFAAVPSGQVATLYNVIPAAVGFLAALVMAYLEKSLITVALSATATVLIVEIIIKLI